MVRKKLEHRVFIKGQTKGEKYEWRAERLAKPKAFLLG